MQTALIPHPDRLAPGVLPESGPVGSIAPFTAFVKETALSKRGQEAFNLRDGFGGRDIDAAKAFLAKLLGIGGPPRSLDMEAALDRARIDRGQIIYEIVQGGIRFTHRSTEDFADLGSASLEDVDTLDGYWVAYWDIQDGQTVSTNDLLFKRVL